MYVGSRRALLFVACLLNWAIPSATAWATDVYVVYSGRDGALRNALVSAMRGLDVKTYNVDILALADYTGKQKAVGKISRAPVVVIIGSRPMRILNKVTIKSNLLVVGNNTTSVKASRKRIYILSKGSSTSGLSGPKITASSQQDLQDADSVRSAGIVLVDGGMQLAQAASLVARSLVR